MIHIFLFLQTEYMYHFFIRTVEKMLVILVRTVILYLLVIAAMRMMGKRQVGELQPSELVIAIMISDVASIPMQNTGVPLLSGIIPILTLLAAELTVSLVSLKSRKFRHIISGKPSVLICHGKINECEMRRQRFNIEDLLEELRISGYADISQIEYAVLETNGQISAIPRTQSRPVTVGDMNLQAPNEQIPHAVIFDGEIDEGELKNSGKNENWLRKQLEANGIENENDVFLAAVDTNGSLFVQKKEICKKKKFKKKKENAEKNKKGE